MAVVGVSPLLSCHNWSADARFAPRPSPAAEGRGRAHDLRAAGIHGAERRARDPDIGRNGARVSRSTGRIDDDNVTCCVNGFAVTRERRMRLQRIGKGLAFSFHRFSSRRLMSVAC